MDISISIGEHSKGSRKLNGFRNAYPATIRRGMTRAGIILERDMKQKLSGPSHVDNPGTGNPYPGVRKNILRGGVNKQVNPRGGVMTLEVGPHAGYAVYLEYKSGPGGYPFVGPTWEDKGDEAIDAIQRAISAPLDRF